MDMDSTVNHELIRSVSLYILAVSQIRPSKNNWGWNLKNIVQL